MFSTVFPADTAIPAERMPPAVTAVTAGSWSFELRGDELADIRFDGVLLLRAVRAVVRDQDWNTPPAAVDARREDWSPAGLRTTLSLRFRGPLPEGPVDYHVELSVVVGDDGLAVSFAGTAASAFRRNRIGLVVLHPLSEAGRAVDHVRTDGSVRSSSWPTTISPHQPFLDVAGFRWERDGVAAELTFGGEVFETEDQRNWTDASFKTYGTPLSLPFPVDVAPGDTVSQSLRLRASRVGGAGSARVREPEDATVTVEQEVLAALPALSVASGGEPDPAWAGDLALDTVLVELTGEASTWPARLASAERQASVLDAALDVRMVCAEPEAVQQGVSLLDARRVVRVGVFHPLDHVTHAELWDALTRASAARDLGATLVAGTRGSFAELNRGIDGLPADADGLTCSITPQVHTTELPHLLDSIEGQRAVARDAARLAAGKPVWLGPVTLRQRFNAVATSDAPVVPDPDPLQPTGFTAVWTLASIGAMSQPGVAGLCYYDAVGPGGIGDRERLYPVGRLVATLAALRGRPVLASRAPAGVACLAVRADSGPRVLLARLGETVLACRVRLPGQDPRTVDLPPWSVTELTEAV